MANRCLKPVLYSLFVALVTVQLFPFTTASAGSKDKEAEAAVEAYLEAAQESEAQAKAFEALNAIHRNRLVEPFEDAIKSDDTSAKAMMAAARLGIPGLFKAAKAQSNDDADDELRAAALTLFFADGDKAAANHVFDIWNEAEGEDFAAMQALMLKWKVDFAGLDKIKKVLKKGDAKSAEALAVLQFQLSTVLDNEELLDQYKELSANEALRRGARSYGVGGKAGEFEYTDPIDTRLFVPESALEGNARLIIGFHGSGDTEQNFQATAIEDGWREICKDQRTIFASVGTVNDGPSFDNGVSAKVAALVSKLKKLYDIDGSRVYGIGFSNGAFYGNYTALVLSDVFAAFIACGLGYSQGYIKPKSGYKVAVLYRGDPADTSFGPPKSGNAYRAHSFLKDAEHDTLLEELDGIGHNFSPAACGKEAPRCWEWFEAHENLTASNE